MNVPTNLNISMSNYNLDNIIKNVPNSMAAAQDAGQSQEIIKEGIKVAQTVQASENIKNSQRVHRKTPEERQQGNNNNDSFERSDDDKNKNKNKNSDEIITKAASITNAAMKNTSSFNFSA